MSKGRGSGFISSQYQRWKREPSHFRQNTTIHKPALSESQSPDETTTLATKRNPATPECEPEASKQMLNSRR
jgi:hypothetical protein